MKDKIKNLLSKIKNTAKNKDQSLSSSQDIENIAKNFFSTAARKSIHKYFVLSAILGLTYNIGNYTGDYLQKKMSTKKSKQSVSLKSIKTINYREDLLAIENANLFNAQLKSINRDNTKVISKIKKPKINIEKVICHDASIKSTLPIKLGDTIVLQDRVKSIASVQVRNKKKPLNLREGEKIENMASISKIGRLSVILKNLKTGKCEFIENAKAKNSKAVKFKVVSAKAGKKLLTKNVNDSIQNTGNKFKIKKAFREKMLADMGTLLTQARAMKIDNSDGSMCFKMTEVVPGSLYTQLDIQNDDIICGINGKKIRSLNELMTLFSKMSEIDHFELSRKRNGEETNIEYNFE